MARLTQNFIRGLATCHLATAINIAYITNTNLFSQTERHVIEVKESEPQIIRSLENILPLHCHCVVFEQLLPNSLCLNPLLRFAADVLPFTTHLERLSMAENLLQGHNRVCLPVIKSFASPIISVFRNKTFSDQAF